MKHMILSSRMKGPFLDAMVPKRFSGCSRQTFRTFRGGGGGPGVLNKIVDFGGPRLHLES